MGFERSRHKREQLLADLRDSLPRMWYGIYQGSVDVGFTPLQAFTLVQTFILSQNPTGIRPNPVEGPQSDREDSSDTDDS